MLKTMPIVVVIIATMLACTAFTQSLRWVQFRRSNTYAFIASNYWMAAIISVCWILTKKVPVSLSVVSMGGVCGILFGISIYILMFCIRRKGVGVTATIMNLAQAIPILVSIIVWKEIPELSTITGMLLIGFSIPLILLEKPQQETHKNVSGTIALAAQFLIQGSIFTIFKWFEILNMQEEKPVMLGSAFVTAALLTTVVVIFHSRSFASLSIFHGLITGSLNIAKNVLIIISLGQAPAPIVLPTLTAATVVLTALSSMLLWHEMYTRRIYIGFLLAIVGLVLINI